MLSLRASNSSGRYAQSHRQRGGFRHPAPTFQKYEACVRRRSHMLIFVTPGVLGERELRASRTNTKYGTCAVIDQVDAGEDAGHVLTGSY